ncbi:sialidase family protein [Rugosimonospora africana]|uniref:exo-alpha-sialidase n=1 Tax=Rugosimonospora africana TaxID=556532 RepID=A0A8J3QRL6_9ACTN|nr:sialidase family protein [Rugosimonospora africana]GIH14542.1 hypothetical protein Raf01_27140 [Rugosimonospora africana]
MPANDRYGTSVPYVSGTEGYAAFRIPAVVATPAGTLLAFAEGRRAGPADTGDIDTVVRRSTDGGRTWGPLRVVAAGGGDTIGNPTPVLASTGRVVLLTTGNAGTASEAQILRGEVSAARSRRVQVRYADHDGTAWTPPRDITDAVKLAGWHWYATGPGHAIRLAHGPHAGRLVAAANHSAEADPSREAEADHDREADQPTGARYGGHCLYSDDDGATWHVGYRADEPDGYVNANETAVAQLPDGRLYVNTRNQNGTAPGNRADGYSRDGGQTLVAPLCPRVDLTGPIVQGSLLAPSAPGAPLLYAGPADPAARAAMTLRASRDAGATWRPVRELSRLPAAYSDLVELDADTIGVLYETGSAGPYEAIAFQRVDLRELS